MKQGLSVVIGIVSCGLALLAVYFAPGVNWGAMRATPFQLIHIIGSVVTLGVLLFAALQAMLLFYYDQALRHGYAAGFLRSSPDLESMERWLFRIIFFGFILLTAIIASSFYFFFPIHASFFWKFSISLSAWLLFAILLWWRHHFGLRGRVAIVATLIGVGVVLGIYIGSLGYARGIL